MFFVYFVGLWIFGALFMRQGVARWRQNMTTSGIKGWILAGVLTIFFFAIKAAAELDVQDTVSWFTMGMCAVGAWVAILAGLEGIARDMRARAQHHTTWEQLYRKTGSGAAQAKPYGAPAVRRTLPPPPPPPPAAEEDPELRELLELEEREAEQRRQQHFTEQADALHGVHVVVDEGTTTVDLTDMFFPQRGKHGADQDTEQAHAQAAALAPQHAAGRPHSQPPPQATRTPLLAKAQLKPQPESTAHSVDLGVTSRFGSGAPAKTAPTSQSVRRTEAMDASPTIIRDAAQAVRLADVSAPEAIALPKTSMPDALAVGTTPGHVPGSSGAKVLGRTEIGSSGRFVYQPRMVESRLGAAPQPPPAAPVDAAPAVQPVDAARDG